MIAIIGHRGAPGHLPEHTRGSYLLAIQQGVDAIEPDVVATRDGVLVVRHENEISSTTDVASRPEYADRRTRKVIDGRDLDGWFAEDFTWDELRTLRARERIPEIRPTSAAHDNDEPILALTEVLTLARDGGIGVVVEIKHATYFASIGIDLAALVARDLRVAGWDGDPALVIEAFEQSALERVREEGIRARYVYLIERTGSPADRIARDGRAAPTYRDQFGAPAVLAPAVDGVSVHKHLLLAANGAELAARVRDAGLELFTWTCRPENAFLERRFRGPGGRTAHGRWREEWRELRDVGATALFADHPDLARELFPRE